ncbi:MAG: DUF4231 domain-containing protein [Anaerolineae bacterium]|nr:DUF4231 domain-containing protein [Anaerolineae bacterium]
MLKTNLPERFVIPPSVKTLFFIKRRPKLRFSSKWPPPELSEFFDPRTWDGTQALMTDKPEARLYHQWLEREGFISPSLLKNASDMLPQLRDDLRELEQHLMPRFWKLEQEAKYFQNLHYLYQWIFILGAFLTSVLAALSVLLYQSNVPDVWINVLGVATTVIGAATGSVSFLQTNQVPQKQWFQARNAAERMRTLYFLYIARQSPFDIADDQERVQHLRRMTLRVLRQRRVQNRASS